MCQVTYGILVDGFIHGLAPLLQVDRPVFTRQRLTLDAPWIRERRVGSPDSHSSFYSVQLGLVCAFASAELAGILSVRHLVLTSSG